MHAFAAIDAPLDGRHFIEASAGTGKTFTIATLYLRVIVERGLRPGNVLVVTYTKAATAELRARLRERVREALRALDGSRAAAVDADLAALIAHWDAGVGRTRAAAALDDALRNFDEAAVHTIHAFCQRMLEDLAFESGMPFDAELVTDEAPLRDEIVRDFWVHETHAAPDALLRHVTAGARPLDALASLALRVAGNPALPVVPTTAPRDPEGLAAAVAAYHAARSAAYAVWTSARATVATLLLESPALHRGQYRVATVRDRWLPALDAILADDAAPWPSAPVPIEKLSNAGLEHGTKKGGTPPTHPFFDACDALAAADRDLRSILAAESLGFHRALIEYVRRERRRRREATHTRAFDDLQQLLHEALAGPAGADLAAAVRQRFPFAMIDECQDTDPLQHAIFEHVYGAAGGLYQIGDPKQAIFAFRGADVFTYLAGVRTAAADTRTLVVNWRSDPQLIDAVHALFARARHPFVLPGIAMHPVGPRPDARDHVAPAFRILTVPDAHDATKRDTEVRVVRGIAAEIAATLARPFTIGEHGVEAGDIAVLCRTNRQAIEVQAALRALGVPSVLRGDKSVFDTPEAEELQRIAHAIATPSDPAAIRAALATTMLGVSGAELHRLHHDEQAWDSWTRRFERWHDAWASHRFVRAFHLVLHEHGVQARVLRLGDGERRLTNILHLAELVHRAETEARLGPAQTIRWLHQLRSDPATRGQYAGDAEQIRLESDANAVTVVTIHKSKGLEYPIVYCPFLWERATLVGDDKRWVRFHDPDDDDRLKLDVGSPAHDAHRRLAEREALAESLRLTYVALTRARHQCTIVWDRLAGSEHSPLAYLLHQPETVADGDLAGATATRVATLDPAALARDLENLAASTAGAIEIRPLAGASGRPLPPSTSGADRLDARTLGRRIAPGLRVSSFTALAPGGARHTGHPEEGVDHDPDTAPALARPIPATPVLLHDFPAGAATGTLIHDILEHLDFATVDAPGLQRAVGATLVRHGFEARATDTLAAALDAVLDTPLRPADGWTCLRDVERDGRLSEMSFVLPVTRTLTPATLAATLARHGAPAACPDYPSHLGALGFEPFAGYLRGAIDLVTRVADRWYVVDYKSNFLGPAPDDYALPHLVDAMRAHHYVLQYHLYALAVDRYLATRLPGYDYGRDFGGVLYLFVRGMAPAHPGGTGVYFDRPAPALMADLATLLAPADPADAERPS
jgi:exodeoxyribonuclease V beta subunit